MGNVLLQVALICSVVLYGCQYIIYKRKGNPQASGSLSFTVIFAMLFFTVFKEFEGTYSLLYLIPAIGIVVGILQFRDSDFPKSLNILSLVFLALQISIAMYQQLS